MKNASIGAKTAAIGFAAVILVACSDGSGGGHESMHEHSMSNETSASQQSHNAADVMFAQQMIPHHQQAIDMAQLAASRSANAEVKALAKKIEAAQGPEIATLNSWLKDWNAPTSMSSEHAGHEMSGMMSEQEMAALQGLSGAAFDRQFLSLMIVHHQGALAMAATQQLTGQHPGAKTMASDIVSSQSAEITAMQQLLTVV